MSNNSVFFATTLITSSTNGASVLVCAVAAFMVFYLRLHKVPAYRLALYQVLASLVFATIETFQVIFSAYDNYSSSANGQGCAAYGWISMYARWVKVLLTVWVTIHIFCFAVLHKNMKRYELLYVVTSLLVPVPIAAVPLFTHTYGINPIGLCFIANGTVGDIENIFLWYGPVMIILFALSVIMVVMVIVLAQRVYRRHRYELIDEDRFWTALKQLLPLSAFPILFLLFIIPLLVAGVLVTSDSTNVSKSVPFISIFIALWSVSSGVTLIVHISVARYLGAKKKKSVHTSSSNPASLSLGSCQQEIVSIQSVTDFRNFHTSVED